MDQLLPQPHAPQCNSVEPEKFTHPYVALFDRGDIFIHRYETTPSAIENGVDETSRGKA